MKRWPEAVGLFLLVAFVLLLVGLGAAGIVHLLRPDPVEEPFGVSQAEGVGSKSTTWGRNDRTGVEFLRPQNHSSEVLNRG